MALKAKICVYCGLIQMTESMHELLPENHEVLYHLLAQVVVNAVDLVLFKQGGQMS